MKRRIIRIDENKCNGCGACAAACHEGAIEMINGKAKLSREDYCDGLGDCLPTCPTNAITFEERDAPAYNEAAVLAAKEKKTAVPLPCGCPGSAARKLSPLPTCTSSPSHMVSQLSHWPVQIKLVPPRAPYFDGAHLLVAADCTAYAYAAIHQDFIRGRITLIGCPKLDAGDYAEKLTQIIAENDIQSITVLRMEVPCCGGLEHAVCRALLTSGKQLPLRVVVVGVDGRLHE